MAYAANAEKEHDHFVIQSGFSQTIPCFNKSLDYTVRFGTGQFCPEREYDVNTVPC